MRSVLVVVAAAEAEAEAEAEAVAEAVEDISGGQMAVGGAP